MPFSSLFKTSYCVLLSVLQPYHFCLLSAKNAIQGLLKVDPAHRITVHELLDHPWMTGDMSRPVNKGPTNVLEMMKQWKDELLLDDEGEAVDSNANVQKGEEKEPSVNSSQSVVSNEDGLLGGCTTIAIPAWLNDGCTSMAIPVWLTDGCTTIAIIAWLSRWLYQHGLVGGCTTMAIPVWLSGWLY